MKSYAYLVLHVQLALFLQRVQQTPTMDLTVRRNVQIGTVSRHLLHVMFRQEAVVSMGAQQAGVEWTVEKVTNNNNEYNHTLMYMCACACWRVLRFIWRMESNLA